MENPSYNGRFRDIAWYKYLNVSWCAVCNVVLEMIGSGYFIGSFKCYILKYINPVCRQPCAQLFLGKRDIMNWS